MQQKLKFSLVIPCKTNVSHGRRDIFEKRNICHTLRAVYIGCVRRVKRKCLAKIIAVFVNITSSSSNCGVSKPETRADTELESRMSETGSSPVASLQDGGSGIRLRQTSQVTLVPNSYPAKLMYYLDCVCTVLELDDDPVMNRLRQYHRCDLTTQQIDTLLSVCYTFGPDLLNKKCFFNNDGLCGTSGGYNTVICHFILHVQRNVQNWFLGLSFKNTTLYKQNVLNQK